MRDSTAGRFRSVLFVVTVVSLGSPLSLSAHPYHVSIADAEWNAESKVLEVALKVNPNDLENALRRQKKRRIKLEEVAAEKLIVQYVRKAFVVRNENQKSVPLTWIGCEITVKDAWLYFEFPLPNRLKQVTIANSVLNHIQGQKNTVSIRDGKRHTTLVFSQRKTEMPVKFLPEHNNTPQRTHSPAPRK